MQLKQVLAPIAEDLDGTDALIRAWLKSDVSLIDQIGHYIVTAGGKRLRPALVLVCARALGGSGELPRLLAAVVEFIHTATLLHDDVVDEADRRRGRETANAVWGNAGAVLSGDFLYSRSFQMMVAAGVPAVMQVMADATNAIAEGEVLQLLNLGDPEVTERRYLEVIERKTARLFQAAAQLGGLAAGAAPQTLADLGAYGFNLGVAYQLVDDLLDYLADPETSGKSLGTDLAEGKPTLPLIRATISGTAQQAGVIQSAIREGRSDCMKEVLAAVEATDAIPYTRALAETYRDSAIAALRGIPESPFKDALHSLACFAVDRRY
jgi:octaprenyl-diphosphate synthase